MRPTVLSVLVGCALAGISVSASAASLQDVDAIMNRVRELRANDPQHRNASEIAELLRPLADAGNPQACAELGAVSFAGFGLTQAQSKMASRYMRCAADAGNPSAAFWVAGDIDTHLTPQQRRNPARTEEVRHYLSLAIEGGHQGAKMMLDEIQIAQLPSTRRGASKSVSQVAHAQVTREQPVVTAAAPARWHPAIELNAAHLHLDPIVVPVGRPVLHLPPVDRLDLIANDDEVVDSQPVPAAAGPMNIPAIVSAGVTASLPTSAKPSSSEVTALDETVAKRVELESLEHARAEKASALNREGIRDLAERRMTAAVAAFREASELGSVAATTNLGLMYLTGDGVHADPAEAAKLLERSAANGNSIAAENLARMYELAIGVPRDRQRAIQWYERASEMGSTRSVSALLRLKNLNG